MVITTYQEIRFDYNITKILPNINPNFIKSLEIQNLNLIQFLATLQEWSILGKTGTRH